MQIQLYQSLPVVDKVRRIRSMNRMVRRLALQSLVAQFPNASEAELNYQYVLKYHGKQVADRFLSTNSV